MSFSYSGDPSTSSMDWIRWRIGDRVSPGHFSNEEILGELALVAGNAFLAGYNLLIAWATEIAHEPDFTIGRFSEQRQATVKAMQEKAAMIAAEGGFPGGVTAGLYAGGISVSDKAAKEADTDRVAPFFKRGMHNYPGTSGDNSETGS